MSKVDSLNKILKALGGRIETNDNTVVDVLDKIADNVSVGGTGGSINDLNYMGLWISQNEYHPNDIVIDGDMLYICNKSINNSTIRPSLDAINWELFASRLQINSLEIEVNNVPPTATAGTITDAQLEILQSSDYATIIFNHERFVLMDKAHTEGFLTYSHVGIENSVIWVKCFTITIATKGWVLTTKQIV